MKPWHRFSICILLGLISGAGFAVHQVRSADMRPPSPQRAMERQYRSRHGRRFGFDPCESGAVWLTGAARERGDVFHCRTDSDGAPLNRKLHLHRQWRRDGCALVERHIVQRRRLAGEECRQSLVCRQQCPGPRRTGQLAIHRIAKQSTRRLVANRRHSKI